MIPVYELLDSVASWLTTETTYPITSGNAPSGPVGDLEFPYGVINRIDQLAEPSTLKRRSGLSRVSWQVTVAALSEKQLGLAVDRVIHAAVTADPPMPVTADNGDTLLIMETVKLPGGYSTAQEGELVLSASIDFSSFVTLI